MDQTDDIAEIAYGLYAKRGKTNGRALDDWLEAERIFYEIHILEQEHSLQKGKKTAKRVTTRKPKVTLKKRK